MSPTLEESLAWAADGAAHLRGLMHRMGDEAFRAPSGLPGWTRAHVLTHVARNADAMVNLLDSARTGVPKPAYASREQRDADIAAGAERRPDAIREDVIESSDRLARVVRAMPEQAWSAQVQVPQGHMLPAAGVPWLRAREVWIHSVDLDVGASFGDMPLPMLRALVDEVAVTFSVRDEAPALRLVPVDMDRIWRVGNGSDPVEVRGTAPAITAWLLGRSQGKDLRTGDGCPLPEPPRWL